MKFLIETSAVPIYNRIASAFAETLLEFGHIVYFINTKNTDPIEFIKIINNSDIDYILSTNELNLTQSKLFESDDFVFNKIKTKIIFIHHDNLFSAYHELNYINSKLISYATIKERSYHFCLEKSNIHLLHLSGIKHAFKISHATEFKHPLQNVDNELSIAFVGHLMSSLSLYPAKSILNGQHLQVLAWNRFSRSSYSIQKGIQELIEDDYFLNSIQTTKDVNKHTIKQFLVAGINKFSSPLRGELISTIKKHRVDIFGGDLSYGTIEDPLLVLNQDNIKYQPATLNYQDSSKIYQNAKININISALQFDTAINNRFYDIISSNGFILTDKRDDLLNEIPFWQEFTFETPEELNEKISYYMNPSNKSRYLEVKSALFHLINNKFTYKIALESILKNIKS